MFWSSCSPKRTAASEPCVV
uniref:Uncharacterized protein n=1 Tax=Anguilla anguilla TaxID=7936 RepID=A0A0E9V9A7_ANGAN